MTRRRPQIPQRRVFFVGCEGESEAAYVALLNEHIRRRALAVALRAFHLNPGAGDPLELVRRALQQIKQRHSRGDRFAMSVVFLDQDKCVEAPARCQQAGALARDHGIHLIWQEPDHEALLLRHLPGCAALRPPRGTSMPALTQRWPEYRKPMTAASLAVRLDETCVLQARNVEPALAVFLNAIGL